MILDPINQRKSRQRVWLLFSGGIDSTACLYFYREADYEVECFYINYGHPASRLEQAAANRLARHFNVPLSVLSWSGSSVEREGEIVGRNAFLYFGALVEIGNQAGILASGLHAGTPYWDCSDTFLSTLQTVVDGYCDGRINLGAPFIHWTKQQVVTYCQSAGLPIDLTYSCERGTDPPCGHCLSCLDRRTLIAL